MTSERESERGEGLPHIDDPVAVDVAFERGERGLGSAVIGLAFNCSLEEASPRIVKATRLADASQRGFAFTAVGVAARRHRELTAELYAALRADGPSGLAVYAIGDTLTFVPFRKLPPWFKWRWVVSAVRNATEGWWLRFADAAGGAWRALRERRLRGSEEPE
ncbi:hypothetical protein ACIBL8_44850 [Streptomyces sp. NPDC050523]|uniref:hypothetical protein n=1 Tax=Streptomyces sp. NPDC050523 TaxID=3365622 RepID=UPI00379BB655